MPSRARKAAVAGVVAIASIAVGVAFASFVSDTAYGGNSASGGKLTVETSGLPLTFGSNQALYPSTDCFHPEDGAVMTASFTVTDNNPVSASYGLKSALDPKATDEQSDQYANLCITITATSPGTPTHTVPGQATPLDSPAAPTTTTVFQGKLKDLDGNLLGTLANGETRTFDVTLSLQNVPDKEQPQGVTTPFTLTVRAETPVTSPSTTTSSTTSTTAAA